MSEDTKSKSSILVGIIENDVLYSETLQLILSRDPQIEILFIAKNTEEALESLYEVFPSVILLDIELGMTKMSGIEALPTLLQKFPDCFISILTIYEEYEKVYDAIQQGALGYILKSESPEKIIESVKELMSGGSPITPSIARKITQSFQKTSGNLQLLSDREIEIIDLISKGMFEKEVAAQLFISPFTVKKHISNIYTKLQVNTRTEALNKLFRK